MPGAGFKQQAGIWREWMLDFVNFPFAAVLKEIVSNLYPYSNAHSLTFGCHKAPFHLIFPENGDGSNLSAQHVEYVKEVAATIFTGNSYVFEQNVTPHIRCFLFSWRSYNGVAANNIHTRHGSLPRGPEEGSRRTGPCCRARSTSGLQGSVTVFGCNHQGDHAVEPNDTNVSCCNAEVINNVLISVVSSCPS